MGIDFSDFNSEDLWDYTYNEVIALIEEMENSLIITSNAAKSIEAIAGTLSCIPIITYRVDEYDFKEISREKVAEDSIARNDRQLLQLRLRTLHVSCKALCESVNIADDYNKKKQELEKAVTDLQTSLGDTKARIDLSLENAQTRVTESLKHNEGLTKNLVKQVQKKLQKAEKKLDDSEHNMLTHVLTLMGVFTAVITIIMSVVITSSSWLNNADGASAFFALAVPNLVAIFAVIVLVGLVFIYQNGVLSKPGKSKVVIWFLSGITALVLILTCLMGWCAISYTQPCKASQVHYVISPSEYSIEQEINSETGKKETFCVFVFEGESFRFPYDNKYIHDGNLYFCKEHRTLE